MQCCPSVSNPATTSLFSAVLTERVCRTSQQVETLQEYLRRVSFLQSLTADQLHHLAAATTGLSLAQGDCIYAARQPSSSVYALLSGHVALLADHTPSAGLEMVQPCALAQPTGPCLAADTTAAGGGALAVSGSSSSSSSWVDATTATAGGKSTTAPSADTTSAAQQRPDVNGDVYQGISTDAAAEGAGCMAPTCSCPAPAPGVLQQQATAAAAPGAGGAGGSRLLQLVHPGQLFGSGQSLPGFRCRHTARVWPPGWSLLGAAQQPACAELDSLSKASNCKSSLAGGYSTSDDIDAEAANLLSSSSSSSTAAINSRRELQPADSTPIHTLTNSKLVTASQAAPPTELTRWPQGCSPCSSWGWLPHPELQCVLPQTEGQCVLLSWDAETFSSIAAGGLEGQLQKCQGLLDAQPALGCLTQEQRWRISCRLQYKEYAPGDAIMKQGEAADSLYFLQYGSAGVLIEPTETLAEQHDPAVMVAAGDTPLRPDDSPLMQGLHGKLLMEEMHTTPTQDVEIGAHANNHGAPATTPGQHHPPQPPAASSAMPQQGPAPAAATAASSPGCSAAEASSTGEQGEEVGVAAQAAAPISSNGAGSSNSSNGGSSSGSNSGSHSGSSDGSSSSGSQVPAAGSYKQQVAPKERLLMQVSVLSEGALIGEMALQQKSSGLRTATLVALEPLVAWRLMVADMQQLLSEEDIQGVVSYAAALHTAANAAAAITVNRARRGLLRRAIPRTLQKKLLKGGGLLGLGADTSSSSRSGHPGEQPVPGNVALGGRSRGATGLKSHSMPGGSSGPLPHPVLPRPWASEAGVQPGSETAWATVGSAADDWHAVAAALLSASKHHSCTGGNAATATSKGSRPGNGPSSSTGGLRCSQPGRPGPQQQDWAVPPELGSCSGRRRTCDSVLQDDRRRRIFGPSCPGSRVAALQQTAQQTAVAVGTASTAQGNCASKASDDGQGPCTTETSYTCAMGGSSESVPCATEADVTSRWSYHWSNDSQAVLVRPAAGLRHSWCRTSGTCPGSSLQQWMRRSAGEHSSALLPADQAHSDGSEVCPPADAGSTDEEPEVARFCIAHQKDPTDQLLLQVMQNAWKGAARTPLNNSRPATFWGSFPLPVP